MRFSFEKMIFENHIDEQENNDKTVFYIFITWMIDNNQQIEAKLNRPVKDLLTGYLGLNVQSYITKFTIIIFESIMFVVLIS